MSLEELLKENTAALNRNSDLLEGISAAAKSNLAQGAGKASEKAPTTEEKPKSTRKAAAEKAPTVKEVTDKTKAFLEVDEDSEYEARRAFVKKIVDKFGSAKMSELEEGDRKAALDYLVAYVAGDETDLDEEEQPTRRSRDEDV